MALNSIALYKKQNFLRETKNIINIYVQTALILLIFNEISKSCRTKILS